jgi:transcriptional regulator with XRE-family HTH domain
VSELKRARLAKKWSGQQLSKLMNVTKQTISNWETGKFEPNINQLSKLALLLETDVEKIMNDFIK